MGNFINFKEKHRQNIASASLFNAAAAKKNISLQTVHRNNQSSHRPNYITTQIIFQIYRRIKLKKSVGQVASNKMNIYTAQHVKFPKLH